MRTYMRAAELEPGDVVLVRGSARLAEPLPVTYVDRTLSGGIAVWRPGQPPVTFARHTQVVVERRRR